jgi:hypothetical protein
MKVKNFLCKKWLGMTAELMYSEIINLAYRTRVRKKNVLKERANELRRCEQKVNEMQY